MAVLGLGLLLVGGLVAIVVALATRSGRPPQVRADGTRFCTACGQPAVATDTFCGFCGTPRAVPAAPGAPDPQQVIGTNGFATASLVLGIVGVSLLAFIFGLVALSQIGRSGGAQRGRGMAIAGVVLSVFWMIASVGIIVALIATGSDSGSYYSE